MSRRQDAYGNARTPQVLSAPADTRARLIDFYRERDAVDAEAFSAGYSKVRGKVYALGLERLESGEDVFESYGVLAAAGIELPADALSLVEKLPQDWSRVCLIDSDGKVWTASVRQGPRRALNR